MDERIRALARGRQGKNLVEVLKDMQREIADIRTPMKNIRPEIVNDVRLGIIEALDVFLIDKLKVVSGELEAPDPNEHI